ncbi:hypothetical protein SCACP_28180 [Sporomusa carbonis]|uniref:DUF2933 domain-containing protein n=1 Tax=Sporomusa carbonis TaxID=3076075 RepID=UPI003A65D7F6
MKSKATDTIQSSHRDCSKEHSGLKHLGMMFICCLVPLAAAFILKQLGYTGIASYLVLLLCPIMHLFMMKGMFKDQAEPQSNIENKNS